MKTIAINEKFTMQFVVDVRDYEAVQNVLRMLSIKYTSEDATKESLGPDYPIAEGRKEVVFRVDTDCKNASHVKWVINHTNT